MNFFKSKEEKEQEKLNKINEKIKKLGLEDLTEEEKEYVLNIYDLELEDLDIIAGTGRSEEDNTKINYLYLLIEQNWLLLKKLNNMEKIQIELLDTIKKLKE